MNYRHIYHAGNFADVLKHCVLIMLAQSLFKKEKTILYLDTHAGLGKYDLTSEIAQKTAEYNNGIAQIYQLQNCPLIVQTYQHIIRAINAESQTLHFYPGSPLIMHALLRTQDQMILTELHPEDVITLKHEFYQDKQVTIHHMDGYQSLKAFLPPKCGRGLILIDPPFEDKNEFTQIILGLQIALQRFAHGIYMVWYPIKNHEEIKKFYSQLTSLKCKNILSIEFAINKNTTNSSLTNCGIAIINAPWQFKNQLVTVISWIHQILAIDQSSGWNVNCLKNNA